MSYRQFPLAMVLLTAACHSSGKSSDAGVSVPDVSAPDLALPVDSAPDYLEASPPDAAPDARPDTAPDAAPDLAPDSSPDRPLSPDVGPDLAIDRTASEVAVPRAGLTISFDDCVLSDVGSKANEFAVSGAVLVATDFDRDGKSDVAVGTWPDNHVITLKGKGDGSFKIVSTKVMSAEPRSLGIADFNKDGIPDVAVGGAKEKSMNVLLGHSDVSVADPVSYPGPTVGGLAIGDLNGDGLMDVVIGNADVPGSAGVFLGTAGGGLEPVFFLNSLSNPRQPLLLDLDGDSRLDLVLMGDAVNAARSNGVQTLRGRGDGSFEPAVGYATVFDHILNVAGDFTSDGIPDVLSFGGSSSVVLLVGKGDGTFVDPPRKLVLDTGLDGWAAADFDLDGRLDLAHSQGNHLIIYRGQGDGTFASPISFWVGSWGPMVANDYDGDGKVDLLLATKSAGAIAQVCAFRNTSK